MVELPPVIVLTGHQDLHLFANAIRAGAEDCLSKHAMTSQSLGQAAVQALAKHHHEQELGRFDKNVIYAFIESSGLLPTVGGQRMAELTVELGMKLGANEYQLELLRLGALLHDIGKLGVSRGIVTKPGPLTPEEREEIQLHPSIGERMCAHLSLAPELLSIIRSHHERWDGTGYVDGLIGVEIPFLTRIVTVTDAFDAMTTDRPYRNALSLREATKRLSQGSGSIWDPEIVETFLSRVRPPLRQVTSKEHSLDAAA
jgi:putative two-component system response regulator